MDLTNALTADLQLLTAALDQAPRQQADLTRSLRSLAQLSESAVSSFVGLSITLDVDGQPVTMTSVAAGTQPGDLRSSLQIPLGVIAPGLSGQVVFYAGRVGAFDGLAAEVRSTWGAGQDIQSTSLTPADVPADALVSGITGAREVSAVNRAVGVLIAGGATPDDARAELGRQAEAAGVSLPEIAERLLRRTSDLVP